MPPSGDPPLPAPELPGHKSIRHRTGRVAACPFCQNPAPLVRRSRTGVFIECARCLARGPRAKNRPAAERKWNECLLI
jgi:ribosomal protein L37AE/L43A